MCGSHYPTLSSSLFVYVSLLQYVDGLLTTTLACSNQDLRNGLMACRAKLAKYLDQSMTDSEFYYHATSMCTSNQYCILSNSRAVLDPRYKDALFMGPMSHYFEKTWLIQCAGEMEMILTLEYSDAPTPASSKISPSAPSVTNPKPRFYGGFSFANQAVLGALKKGTPATESPAAQLKKYLGEGLIDSEDNPLQWWKDNAHRFPLEWHVSSWQFLVNSLT